MKHKDIGPIESEIIPVLRVARKNASELMHDMGWEYGDRPSCQRIYGAVRLNHGNEIVARTVNIQRMDKFLSTLGVAHIDPSVVDAHIYCKDADSSTDEDFRIFFCDHPDVDPTFNWIASALLRCEVRGPAILMGAGAAGVVTELLSDHCAGMMPDHA